MGFAIKIIEPPQSEPVSLDEFKAHAKISDTDEDSWRQNILIPAARAWCEKYTGRAFITQTLRITLDYFPACIEALRPPLISVESLTYVDDEGDTVTLDDALYRVETDNEPGIIEPAYGTLWPSTLDVSGAVKLTYVAGYGGADDVPAPIKMAVLLLAADWNIHRENMATETVDSTVTRMLSPYWTGLYSPTPEG